MYIIPANSKKSMLILGFFTPLDLIIFLIGLALTIILLIAVKTNEFTTMILILLPAMTCTALVMPVPYYHNILQLIRNFFGFFSRRRKFIWKGWCWHDNATITK